MKVERIRADLEKARQKAAEWQARAKDLERRLTEQEDLEIIQAVRSITASPEELGDILRRIRSMRLPTEMPMEISQEPQNNMTRKETDQNEEEIL